MKKWEYLVERFEEYYDLEDWLDGLGLEGWELVTHHSDYDKYIFKRECIRE